MPRISHTVLSAPMNASYVIRTMRWAVRAMLGLIVAMLGTVQISLAAPGEAQSAAPQSFDYVILALSWSPTYCAASAKRSDSPQCRNAANRGFVLHGLWPQAHDGAKLRCPAGKSDFSKALFERALEIFPDLYLAQSQWQRHGQCFGFSPDAYLEHAALAKSKLAIPDALRAVDKPATISPDKIRSDFIAANGGLSKDSISVSCRKSELVEVLICMKSDLSGFMSCPQIAKRSCRADTVQIPAFQQR